MSLADKARALKQQKEEEERRKKEDAAKRRRERARQKEIEEASKKAKDGAQEQRIQQLENEIRNLRALVEELTKASRREAGPAGLAPGIDPDPSTLSSTERHYLNPKLLHPHLTLKKVPLEALRGLLYVLTGKLQVTKSKKELRDEIRRYLKYEPNREKLLDAIVHLAGVE